MKPLFVIVLFLFFGSHTIYAQHSISINAGWTISNLYKVASIETFNNASYYDEHLNLTLFDAPYASINYNYLHNNFRLSTGLSALSLGANNYILYSGVGYMYLVAPILAGYQVNFSEKFSMVIEGGADVGLGISRVASVSLPSKVGVARPYIGMVFGLEGKYKRFSLGAKFHLGLNVFEEVTYNKGQNVMHLKHIGGTVYIGYTLWDSSKNVKRKKK